MRFFRADPSERPPYTIFKLPSGPFPPLVEGWPENELEAISNAAPVTNLKKGETAFPETLQNDSVVFVVEGAVEMIAKLNGQAGQPVVFRRGDCIGPLLPMPDLSYCAQAIAESAIVEVSPVVLKRFTDRAQLFIFKAIASSTAKTAAAMRVMNGDLSSKNMRLSQYILNESSGRNAALQTDFVREFLRNMKRLPAYATDLAAKLLDEQTSIQEVVEGIRSDPSLVALVLRTVNSAQYSFEKKIESFYHACMILGFNNIYNLLMREAAQSTMPITRETTRIHKHSCIISMLCFEIISLVTEQQQSQTAATLGLLHDLGKSVKVIMRNTHPEKTDFINTLDSSKLGAAALRAWGIPERVCKIVEFQHHPEFMPPSHIAPEYRREVSALHLSHVLEMLLTEKPIDPIRSIYVSDYMAVLGFGYLTPRQLLEERILPSLIRHRARIPSELQNLILKPPLLNT